MRLEGGGGTRFCSRKRRRKRGLGQRGDHISGTGEETSMRIGMGRGAEIKKTTLGCIRDRRVAGWNDGHLDVLEYLSGGAPGGRRLAFYVVRRGSLGPRSTAHGGAWRWSGARRRATRNKISAAQRLRRGRCAAVGWAGRRGVEISRHVIGCSGALADPHVRAEPNGRAYSRWARAHANADGGGGCSRDDLHAWMAAGRDTGAREIRWRAHRQVWGTPLRTTGQRLCSAHTWAPCSGALIAPGRSPSRSRFAQRPHEGRCERCKICRRRFCNLSASCFDAIPSNSYVSPLISNVSPDRAPRTVRMQKPPLSIWTPPS